VLPGHEEANAFVFFFTNLCRYYRDLAGGLRRTRTYDPLIKSQNQASNCDRGQSQLSVVSLPVRRGRRRFPVGESPTRRTLQPEATGAGMEETKCLKPLARAVTTW